MTASSNACIVLQFHSKSKSVVEMKQHIGRLFTGSQLRWRLSVWVILKCHKEPGCNIWTQMMQKINTHEDATHFVDLMRGLLPKRNDGRSSEIVPFRRRNFSVRSNPVNRITKGLLDSNGQCNFQSYCVHSERTCDVQGTI